MQSRKQLVLPLNRYKFSQKKVLNCCCFILLLMLFGCSYNKDNTISIEQPVLDTSITSTPAPLNGPITAEFATTRTPLPESIEALVVILQQGSILERITASRKVASIGAEAVIAVAALIDNLSHEDFEVRREAARSLGKIGEPAKAALPFLIESLTDVDIVVRDRSAWALGQLGDKLAVPALAETLYTGSEEDYYRVATEASHSIEQLIGIGFVEPSYKSDWRNDSGIPFIVVEAREWWEKKGQSQDWLD